MDITNFTRFIGPVASGAYSIEKLLQAVSPYHDQGLTSREAARYLGTRPATLARWRMERRSPAYWKASGKYGTVAYAFSELVAWKQQQSIRRLSNARRVERLH